MRALLVIAAFTVAACEAPLPTASLADDTAGKQFGPAPPDLAALYVYQGRTGARFTITAGQQTLGIIGKHNWLRVDLPPGRTDVRCTAPAITDGVESLILDLQPGTTTYVSAALWLSKMGCHLEVEQASMAKPIILAGQRMRELR